MSGTIQYTIRPYDTIWMLAQVFNTTVDSIMELNPGIEPRNLQIGQVVTIRPGYQYYPSYPNGLIDERMMNGRMPIPETPPAGTPPAGTPPTGMPPAGMPQGGMTPNGGMRNGMMPNGNMMNGMMPDGGMRNGMMNGSMMNGTMPNGNMMNGMMPNGGMTNGMMNGNAMADLTNFMHMLWEQHIAWTFFTILSIIHNLPERELVTQRLLRNSVDFGDAFLPFYGEGAAQSLTELLTEHLTIAAELVQAAMDRDNEVYSGIEQRWFENANQIAEFLASINPDWSEEDWSAMMDEHLELLAASIADIIAQNYESAINRYDDIEMQALEMADMMAEGIAMQFPGELR